MQAPALMLLASTAAAVAETATAPSSPPLATVSVPILLFLVLLFLLSLVLAAAGVLCYLRALVHKEAGRPALYWQWLIITGAVAIKSWVCMVAVVILARHL